MTPEELKALLAGMADQTKAIKDMTEFAKEKAAVREEKAAESKPEVRKNPNADRYKSLLTDSGDKSNKGAGESDQAEADIELPAAWKAAPNGALMGRALRCAAIAGRMPDGEEKTFGIAKVSQDVFRDKALAKYFEQTIAKDLSSIIPTGGAALISTPIQSDWIEFLRPSLPVDALGMAQMAMPYGTTSIPVQTGTSQAFYLGEGDDGTASNMTIGMKEAKAKKLMSLLPIPNELMRTPGISIDMMVANDARKAQAVTINYAILNGVPGIGIVGLANETGITPVTMNGQLTADMPTYFRTTLLNVNVDVDTLAKPGHLISSDTEQGLFNLKSTTGDYLYRDEMRQKRTILGDPYRVTQMLKLTGGTSGTTFWYYGDWSQLQFYTFGGVETTSSDVGSYPTAGGMVSAMARDQTVIRMIVRHDVILRQAAELSRAVVQPYTT